MLIVSGVGMSWAGEPVTRSDRSFRNDRAQGAAVYGLAVRSDGRIWAGGDFTRLGGGSATNLALLETDGSLAPGFVSGLEAAFEINSVLTEPDGGCLVTGSSSSPHAPPSDRGKRTFFRIGPDGRVDHGFPGWTNEWNVAGFRLVRLPDGGSLLAEAFLEWPVAFGGLLKRFSAAGEWDPTFAANLALTADNRFGPGEEVNQAPHPRALDVLPLPDGDFLVGGSFSGVTNWPSRGLIKLSPTGEVRRDWASPLALSSQGSILFRLLDLEDGSILVAGSMALPGWTNRVHVMRLKPDLSIDEGFHLVRIEQTPLVDNNGIVQHPTIHAMTTLADGRIVLGGLFFQVDGYLRRGLCVLRPDGTVDPAVETGWGVGIDYYNVLAPITSLLPWIGNQVGCWRLAPTGGSISMIGHLLWTSSWELTGRLAVSPCMIQQGTLLRSFGPFSRREPRAISRSPRIWSIGGPSTRLRRRPSLFP